MDLPVIHVTTRTLPEGWETACLRCWREGITIPTQYDRPGDPPSRDCMLVLTVEEPFAEPRLHRCMPGGLDSLEEYVQEVVHGIHDDRIDMEDPQKWHYTYHQRFTAYPVRVLEEAMFGGGEEYYDRPFDQLDNVIRLLAAAPCSRRAQAVTWNVSTDARDPHCPCVQRLWFRLLGDRLVMHLHIRSNDAYKAAFMNMYAMTELQAHMAQRLAEATGRPIVCGQYNHIADSFHIYGSYFEDFRGFLEGLEKRWFSQRTWTTTEVQHLLDEARVQREAKACG